MKRQGICGMAEIEWVVGRLVGVLVHMPRVSSSTEGLVWVELRGVGVEGK